MVTKEVTYVDFNGEEQTEVIFLHLSRPEIVRLDTSFVGGLEGYISNIDPQRRPQEIVALLEKIVTEGYGEKSPDGRRFDKSPELTAQFRNSAAYDALFMEILENSDQAAEFFTSMITPSKKKPKKGS